MKLNEAEAFLQSKISGKVLNFSDFVNEKNEDEMEQSEYDIFLYALRNVTKRDIDTKMRILKLAGISCTSNTAVDLFDDFVDNSENIMEIYDNKYHNFQVMYQLLDAQNYINDDIIKKVKKQINENVKQEFKDKITIKKVKEIYDDISKQLEKGNETHRTIGWRTNVNKYFFDYVLDKAFFSEVWTNILVGHQEGKTPEEILTDIQNDKILNEDTTLDGYGNQAFYFAKNGDTSNYFFKLTDGKEQLSYVISIGKFAKFVQPTEAKANYGVITLTQLKEEVLDQAVLDKGIFQTNSEMINVSEGQVTKLLNHLGIIIEDYLQKNPQINKFYDEMQATLQTPQLENKFSVSLAGWPGSNSVWKFQVLEPGRLNVIQK